jgi:hypothetical protein
MTRASRWVLAAAIAGSALAVGTVHTVTLCIATAVLAVAAVLAWWGAEPMKARSAATLLLFTGIGLTASIGRGRSRSIPTASTSHGFPWARR